MVGIEVSHEFIFQLLKGVYALWLESGILSPGHLVQSSWEGDAKESVGGTLNLQMSLVSLKMVQRLSGAVIQIQLGHPKLTKNATSRIW